MAYEQSCCSQYCEHFCHSQCHSLLIIMVSVISNMKSHITHNPLNQWLPGETNSN